MRTARIWLGLLLLPALSCQQQPPAPSAAAAAAQRRARNPDYSELVLQPRRGWTPEAQAQKVSLLLLCEKDRIKFKEQVRYRIEIRNVGRDPVVFKETGPSFIKEGSLCGAGGFRFEVAGKAGAFTRMPCQEGPAGRPPQSGLDLELWAGEFLLTRSGSPADRFRDLLTPYRFKRGTYRIRAVYAPLRAVSNTIVFDVY